MTATARRRPVPASVLGIYLADINETPLLTRQEECELGARIARGDRDARDHMVRANLRLVVNIARGFLGKGVGMDDLIAEGNLGLMRAVEGYDATMGPRFATYASYWIKQSIRAAITKTGKPVRLPAYMVTLLTKWRRASRDLAERLGREPAPEEVGRALKLPEKRLAMAMQALEVAKLTAISDESGEESPDHPLEALADDRRKSAEVRVIEADEHERIAAGLGCLSERESRVIRMRFGLGTDRPMTLAEIGEALDMTRERVRQIEKKATRQLLEMLRSRPATRAFCPCK
jgi:RNA polymerase primary sigma factor